MKMPGKIFMDIALSHIKLLPPETCKLIPCMHVISQHVQAPLLLRGKLYQIDNLCCARGPQSTHTVVKLGEAGGNAADSKLGLCLSKPNSSIICPELWVRT